ncbi:MAG: cardiolipin synthase [Bauldia sp.]|nr:cardiolipin synthase [Bauldia sp.]
MTKEEVRAALGWAAVAILSPFIGATVYAVAGVNRIRRSRVAKRRGRFDRSGSTWDQVSLERIAQSAAPQLVSLKRVGDTVAAFPYTDGNTVTLLEGGDQTYPAMLEAIAAAEKSVAFQSYILDDDPIGRRFVEAFAAARDRGVEVRILLDAVGVRYSRPPIVRKLRDAGLEYGLFMGNLLPMRLPYANLRTHRKLLIVDGSVGFTGGMNVRDEFTTEIAGAHAARDTHFRFEGPVVSQLLHIFSGDWLFTTGEKLTGTAPWRAHSPDEPGPVPCRPIDSGPDEGLERTHAIILGALAVAEERIRIATPYFLPDARLTAALGTAARRGIQVDVVLPKKGNLRLIDWAVAGQLEQVLIPGCRVWRAEGAFDHSKLMVVDGGWALVGSSNLDPRSLRLNFELDVEIMHRPTALLIERRIEAQIANAHEETLETLHQRAFPVRFRNRLIWLASPYL